MPKDTKIDVVDAWIRVTLADGTVHVIDEQAPPYEKVVEDLERLQGYAPSDDQSAEIEKSVEESCNNFWSSGESEYKHAYIWMNEDEISHSLSKQLSSMEYIHTNYGDLPLDIEMQETVEQALRDLLEKRLSKIEAIKKFKSTE